eukprot:13498636-Ditylum_brightwellii.AAC.1
MANMSVNAYQDYWYNKQQGGEVLPNLEHLFKGFDQTDIFQWELSIQMWAHGATSLTNINEVGNKDMAVLIGHLTGANQKAVHCLIYQDDIHDLLNKSLNTLEEDEQEEYLNTYGTTMEDAIYDIQICSGNPKINVDGFHMESEAMAIYARKSHAKLPSNSMEYIAPTSS